MLCRSLIETGGFSVFQRLLAIVRDCEGEMPDSPLLALRAARETSQLAPLHARLWMSSGQDSPPFRASLSTRLSLLIVPSPQSTSHPDHGPHSLT
jgi:hypothetical protein